MAGIFGGRVTFGGARVGVGRAGAYKASLFPNLGAVIEIPELFDNSAAFRKAHRAMSKQALRDTLLKHHKEVVPGHFKASAAAKYQHQPRQEGYKTHKMSKSPPSYLDLIYSGKTKRAWTQRKPKVSVSGQAESGLMKGTAHYKFPFPVTSDNLDPRYVGMRQMAREFSAWTPSEVAAAAKTFRVAYHRLFMRYIKSGKKGSKRIGTKYASAGKYF